MIKANVYITLRAGVLDPQGQAVHSTLGRMGFEEVSNVRIGKFVELELDGDMSVDAARSRVEDMCRKLIANTVIEDFRVEIVK